MPSLGPSAVAARALGVLLSLGVAGAPSTAAGAPPGTVETPPTDLASLPPPREGELANLPFGFSDELVVWNLQYPVNMAFLPDGRLLVVERVTGHLRLIVDRHVAAVDPVLAVPEVRAGYGEQGLLGVAVDPGWPARPFVYVMYTRNPGSICIDRYPMTGDLEFLSDGSLLSDPGLRYNVLTVPDFNLPHNGGTLRFGPDGMLYASLGDDLFQCDAQDPGYPYGKIFRLDVSGLPAGPGGPPTIDEIAPPDNPFLGHPLPMAHLVWQYGLRNPWSFHIDPLTGDLFIADVGADGYEEIDWATEPGMNFGWAWYEGPAAYAEECTVPGSNFVFPIHAYDRTEFAFGAAVISGGIYRRTGPGSFPEEYEGDYFFSDLGEGFLRRLKNHGSYWDMARQVPGQPGPDDWGRGFRHVVQFLQGPDGAIWYVTHGTGPSGQISRIVYRDPLADVGDAGHPDGDLQVRPTPTRGPLDVSFRLAESVPVTVAVHDVRGRLVRVIESATLAAGEHALRWDGRDASGASIASGVYYLRVRAGSRTWSRRVPVLR
jgi:glucose/arabinose dehydrogenase